ncbi:MAG: hypothetical protein D6796_12055 [Caldilineae bacterium]|nr:MAG: hypothetical protein D6796_12055 [Caldilineae bacterium]
MTLTTKAIRHLLDRPWLLVVLALAMVIIVETIEQHFGIHWGSRFTFWLEALLFGVMAPAAGVLVILHGRQEMKQSLPPSRPSLPRRVLLVEYNRLLGAGITSILAGEKDLLITGVSPTGRHTFFQAISAHQPDVLVLDEAIPWLDNAGILSLLKTYPRLQLILVSATSNWLKVYRKEQILLKQAADLKELLRQSPSPHPPSPSSALERRGLNGLYRLSTPYPIGYRNRKERQN